MFYKVAAVVGHIAIWGIVAAVVDPHVPPVCLIVDVVNQVLRHFHTAELQHIHTAQLLVAIL